MLQKQLSGKCPETLVRKCVVTPVRKQFEARELLIFHHTFLDQEFRESWHTLFYACARIPFRTLLGIPELWRNRIRESVAQDVPLVQQSPGENKIDIHLAY